MVYLAVVGVVSETYHGSFMDTHKMSIIKKHYTPDEMKDILSRLKDICDVFLKNKEGYELVNRPLENWIILALYKQGYRIVKIGKIK